MHLAILLKEVVENLPFILSFVFIARDYANAVQCCIIGEAAIWEVVTGSFILFFKSTFSIYNM